MRVLVVGAGATGGYFGGRLIEAGADVTFLVRAGRRAQLVATGLAIRSPFGDFTARPATLLADEISSPFDLVLLGCKAYDLDGAIAAIIAAVGHGTAILPMLNGMRHLDALDHRLGAARVLGGLCAIAATLDGEGRIVHLNRSHLLVYGERDGARSARVEAIEALMRPVAFVARHSETILLEMWEKWAFIATLAGITCLMRAAVCDVMAAGGLRYTLGMLDEAVAVAAASGCPLRPGVVEQYRAILTDAGSPLTASMLRDVEQRGRVEAEHMLGDFLERGRALRVETPLLALANTHLRAYEARRAREG